MTKNALNENNIVVSDTQWTRPKGSVQNDSEVLHRPGISKETLMAVGVREVSSLEAKTLIGFEAEGIAIPYMSVGGGKLMVNGRAFHRIRLTNPINGSKYRSPAKSGAQVYWPLAVCGSIQSDVLVLTEGEFKALALAESGILAAGVGGISSAMTGGKLLPNLAKLIETRKVKTLAFLGDTDTALNYEFSWEAVKLRKALPDSVRLVLPRVEFVGPKGIDDTKEQFGELFLGKWNDYMANAVEVSAKISADRLAWALLEPVLEDVCLEYTEHEQKLLKFANRLGAMAFEELTNAFCELRGVKPLTFKAAAKEHQKDSQPAAEVRQEYSPDDIGRAQRFVDTYVDDVRYIPARDLWLTWNEDRWMPDEDGAIKRLAIALQRRMLQDVGDISGLDPAAQIGRKQASQEALACGDVHNIKDYLEMARCDCRVILPVEKLDSDPWVIGAQNHVVDLRTGDVRAYGREDYITKRVTVAIDPSATCPRWQQFMIEVFPDECLRRYVWKVLGYCLTGITREQVFFFLYGGGSNGKSVLVSILNEILGELSKNASDSLIEANDRGADNRRAMAYIFGARVVWAAETEQCRRFNEKVIKDLTGGDKVHACAVYEKGFEFRPLHKLLIYGNHKPGIRGTDNGIWRRVRLIPFTQNFENRKDPDLFDKLKAELPGIFNWMVQGCRLWQDEGLGMPDAVRQAVQEYREDEDLLGDFIEDSTTVHPTGAINHPAVFKAYQEWCQDNGHRFIMTSKSLAKALRDRGWSSHRTNACKNVWEGRTLLMM